MVTTLNRFEDQVELYDDKAKFTYELQMLKAMLKMSLRNQTKSEKENLLDNFYKILPEYIANYIMDEFDKQYVDQRMIVYSQYLQLMQPDLSEIGLLEELANILQNLTKVCALQSLEEKKLKYEEILENISLELNLILDSQPIHELILTAHLNFLKEFIDTLCVMMEEQESIEEYKPDLNVLSAQLEIAQDGEDVNEKLIFLNMFNDRSTKFGRFLNYKFNQFQFKYSRDF